MIRIIGVRFKENGKIYYFSPGELTPQRGDHVIVETARGPEYGEVVMPITDIQDEELVSPLKEVIRIATTADAKQMEANRRKEKEAFDICVKKIEKHKLEMKLIQVEYSFDGNKILFYFTANGRVDFRELVKDLASVFRTRIELRQVGVRDEAKLMGGLCVCGRPLCCSTFLSDFQPVSIKMAKEQNLSLNPTKISGTCGRLMCCLKYEQDAYEAMNKITPPVGALVKTPRGNGIVMSSSLLQGLVKIRLNGDDENTLVTYAVDEVKLLKKPRRADKVDEIELEELKNLEG